MSRPAARILAAEVAPFIEQALHFHAAARAGTRFVRPLLQYYAYLNLAVAVVRIRQPKEWEGYRRHGAEDLTRSLQKLSLSSKVVRVRAGTISLFHSVISGGILPSSALTLRDLLIPIHLLSHELAEQFDVRSFELIVRAGFSQREDAGRQLLASSFTFQLADEEFPAKPRKIPFPAARISAAMPLLASDFVLESRTPTMRRYRSRQEWTVNNRERAQKFHDRAALQLKNYGGHNVSPDGEFHHAWRFEPKVPIIPTVTAGLLLSFVLSCLARYRADVLERVDSSRVNLLCEVFASEADSFMLPTFRNLLYSEEVHLIQRVVV